MKKMEKTAGEKPGKDTAIRKDNEASAEKIVVRKVPEKGSKENDAGKRDSDQDVKKELKKKARNSEVGQKKNEVTQTQSTEKGEGLKSAVEGRNSDSPLPTDDDGTIVL